MENGLALTAELASVMNTMPWIWLGARRLPNCAPGGLGPACVAPLAAEPSSAASAKTAAARTAESAAAGPPPPGPPPPGPPCPPNCPPPGPPGPPGHPSSCRNPAARSAPVPGSSCPRPERLRCCSGHPLRGAPGAAASGRGHLALQLRFKLIPAALRAAHASHALGHRRFLQLQRKIDLRGRPRNSISCVAGSKPNMRTSMEHSPAGARGERVMAVLVRSGDEFLAANGGRDGRAGNRLVRRLDDTALGIQPSAGGKERKEKKDDASARFADASRSNDDRRAANRYPVKTL